MKTNEYFAKVPLLYLIDTWKLCTKPYHGNLKGCPNWAKKEGCPPNCNLIQNAIDLSKDVWIIYNSFNIGKFAARMKDKHPNWTEKQMYCCRYWQPTARKQLREKIVTFKHVFPDLKIVTNPEAQGVDITATMAEIGIILDWPPRKTSYQVVLAGIKK